MDNEVNKTSDISNNPLVSVIIPVYNVEKYLRQCLDSVLAQTYTKYEVLLIDDGSTDSSADICREYCKKDSRFKLYQKQNGGASSARNHGLICAKGDYLYFLDSDDYLQPTALEKMVACACQNNADLVFIEGKTINDQNALVIGKYSHYKQYPPNSPYLLMEEMMDHKEFYVGTPFFFIKKEVFDKNNIRFKEGIISEDMIMAYQLCSLSVRGATIHEEIYVRRYRPNSVTTSAKTEKNYVSMATVYWDVSKFRETLPKNKQSPKHVIRCAFNVLDIYRHMPKEVQNKHKEGYQKIVQDILDKDAFGDKALKLDCKSHLLWGVYKLKKKIF